MAIPPPCGRWCRPERAARWLLGRGPVLAAPLQAGERSQTVGRHPTAGGSAVIAPPPTSPCAHNHVAITAPTADRCRLASRAAGTDPLPLASAPPTAWRCRHSARRHRHRRRGDRCPGRHHAGAACHRTCSALSPHRRRRAAPASVAARRLSPPVVRHCCDPVPGHRRPRGQTLGRRRPATPRCVHPAPRRQPSAVAARHRDPRPLASVLGHVPADGLVRVR